MDSQLFQYHLFKRLLFPVEMRLPLCEKSTCWLSMDLPLMLLSATLICLLCLDSLVLKSAWVGSPTSSNTTIILAVIGHLHFHISLRISLTIYIFPQGCWEYNWDGAEPIGHWGELATWTTASLPTHEHTIFFPFILRLEKFCSFVKFITKYFMSLCHYKWNLKLFHFHHCTPTKIAKIQHTDSTRCCQGCEATRILVHGWQECKTEQPHWKTVWQFLQN